MVTLLLMLACGETVEPPVVPIEVPALPPMDPAPDGPPPPGLIGGAPILERPVILGGIANEAIEAALDLDAVKACNGAGKPGKVLAKFGLGPQGEVLSYETSSTTLRHEETEACIEAVVRGTDFPALERGERARVMWTFSL